MRILVPTDGSEASLKAAQHAAGLVAASPGAELHLLNVQPALPSAVTTFIEASVVKDFHREEGEKEEAAARQILADAGITPVLAIEVGRAAERILAYAEEKGCTQIVMGTRGLSKIPSLILGSVA